MPTILGDVVHTFITFVVLSLIATSCLKRRQVADKSPSSGNAGPSCSTGTKLHRLSDGKLVCVATKNGDDGQPDVLPSNDNCGEGQERNERGFCQFIEGVNCPEGEEKKMVRGAEKCVPEEEGEEPTEEDPAAEDGETPEIRDEEQQPLLKNITPETKLNTIAVKGGCVGDDSRCFNSGAKELICQTSCAPRVLEESGASRVWEESGRKNLEIIKITDKGELKQNSNTLCGLDSGATLNKEGGNKIECYLAKGGWLFGWGSRRIATGSDCKEEGQCRPFYGLTTKTVGLKYMCVVSLDTEIDGSDKNYLEIYNKECRLIEGNDPKLQLEFSLK